MQLGGEKEKGNGGGGGALKSGRSQQAGDMLLAIVNKAP